MYVRGMRMKKIACEARKSVLLRKLLYIMDLNPLYDASGCPVSEFDFKLKAVRSTAHLVVEYVAGGSQGRKIRMKLLKSTNFRSKNRVRDIRRCKTNTTKSE